MISLKKNLDNFEKKQLTVSLLALIAFLGVSLIINYFLMADRSEQTAKLISRMIQTEDFREVGSTLQLARLDYFKKIQYISDDPRKSFTLPAIAEISESTSLFRFLVYDRKTVNVNELVISNPGDQIIFEFNRLSLMPMAFLVWLILNIVSIPQTRFMKKRIIQQYQKDLITEKDLAQAEVSKKVRHNIRTPLSALLRLSNRFSAKGNDDQNDLFQSIISQIQGLISELDPHQEDINTLENNESIWNTLRHSISENRLAIPTGVLLESRLEDSVASAKVRFSAKELRSILSNLVTNSLEAMNSAGRIEMTAQDLGGSILIEVRDNGPGIPLEIIDKVTEKGFSSGKPSGTGLGLYHAQTCLKSWGGNLEIHSQKGGTLVRISLPIADRELWYVPRLKISNQDRLIIVDDQVSIHRLWKMRLDEVGFTGQMKSFFNLDEFKKWELSSTSGSMTHYFVDYDLGLQNNGLEYLETLSSNHKRYLVTGSFDDSKIQSRCSHLGIYLIPKPELAEIPIVL